MLSCGARREEAGGTMHFPFPGGEIDADGRRVRAARVGSAHVRTRRGRGRCGWKRDGTGRDTCEHMPRRQAVVARASGASLPFTLPAPIMHVSTVPRASAHACMCQCLARLAPGIAKPSALHSDIPSSNDVAS